MHLENTAITTVCHVVSQSTAQPTTSFDHVPTPETLLEFFHRLHPLVEYGVVTRDDGAECHVYNTPLGDWEISLEALSDSLWGCVRLPYGELLVTAHSLSALFVATLSYFTPV